MTTDGPILDDEVRVRVGRSKPIRDLTTPVLLGDRLTVEQNSNRISMFGRAGCEEGHRPLDSQPKELSIRG